ncbi:MAG: histidine kinase, partial [Deltaproteobacteria bacterium]|nr:histidine kinase [Deltaproteobacteria bacterium]
MRIWNKINLSKRIYILLCSLVLITSAGGIILVWYTYRIDERLTRIIEKNIAAYRAAEELETALVNQKGFVSYYLLDSNPDWLRQLGTYRQIFKERLRITRDLAEDSQQKEAINRIAVEYARFIDLKDRVIVYYEMGQQVAGAE